MLLRHPMWYLLKINKKYIQNKIVYENTKRMKYKILDFILSFLCYYFYFFSKLCGTTSIVL